MFGIGRCFGFGGYGYGGYGYGGTGWMTYLFAGGICFVLMAATIYFVYRLFSNNKQDPSAINILNDRFAKGEINEEEYIAKKKQMKM